MKTTGAYLSVHVDAAGRGVVSHAGGVLHVGARYVPLVGTIVLGLGATVLGNPTGHPHDHRETVAPRFQSILLFRPDTGLVLEAPLGLRLHVPAAWALFAFWPFSRLVRVFSMRLGYLTRPYIVYRGRGPRLGDRRLRRGWERTT